MALPVDTTGEDADCSPEEYREIVEGMMAAEAAIADPPALGDELPDFGGTSSVHSSPSDATMAVIDANLKAISIGPPCAWFGVSWPRRADRGAPVTSSIAAERGALGRCQRPRLHAKRAAQRSGEQGFGVIWTCCFHHCAW